MQGQLNGWHLPILQSLASGLKRVVLVKVPAAGKKETAVAFFVILLV